MRLGDFINKDYLDEIKYDMISSKIFIPEVVRSFLTPQEIQANFDESLREKYGQEKMAFREEISSLYIAFYLLDFIHKNNYWELITDKTAFLNFLKEIIEDDLNTYSERFSNDEKIKYSGEYNHFLELYDKYI